MNLFKTLNKLKEKDKFVNFENLQYAVKHPEQILILNTLSRDNQRCLIYNTVNERTDSLNTGLE